MSVMMAMVSGGLNRRNKVRHVSRLNNGGGCPRCRGLGGRNTCFMGEGLARAKNEQR